MLYQVNWIFVLKGKQQKNDLRRALSLRPQRSIKKEMKNSIPLLLSIIILSFTTNTAFAQRPPAYMFGYNLALNATTTSQCNIFAKTETGTGISLSTPDFDLCIAGFNNAQSNIAQTSPAYKTGYDLGKRDSMINTQDATSACRGFVSDVQWMCKQGYDKGYHDYVNIIQSGDNK
jgi:hypothetical protein